ncbi:MAG TPA: YncE family protein [Bacteroidota bacterium]|nr:YncE family protein [Bacteroidota bacterium]
MTHPLMRQIILIVVPGLLAAGCSGVESPVGVDYDAIQTIVYSQHVQPLLSDKCATSGCHSTADRAAGLALTSWDDLIAGSDHGEVMITRRAKNSLLTLLFDGTILRKSHPVIPVPLTVPEVNFLKRWIDGGAANDAGVTPFQNATQKVYVPNQGEDNVSIIDREHMVVMKIVDVGTSQIVEGPHFVTANGDFWYVSLINAGEVWKFDARTDTLVAKAMISGAPALLALTPDGSKLYVSQFTTVFTNKLTVVNTATMTLSGQITVWSMPHGLRMNHAGTRVYVANMMADNVSVIDVATDSVVATVPLAWDANPMGTPKYMPMEVAVSPDDSLVAVACSETREVRMISTASNTVMDSIVVGDQPWHLQFTPDNTFCYVTNRRDHTVSAIHLPMHHVMKVFETPTEPRIFNYPHGCDISPDGQYTFVSNENSGHVFIPRYNPNYAGNVVVIDNVLAEIVRVLEVGKMPTGLSVSP